MASDPHWPDFYLAARDEVLHLLPQPPRLIEHIGSTAVPGLAAKPVIDIIVLLADMAPVAAAIPRLETVGYEFRPDASDSLHLFLRRYGPDGSRTHHLHLHGDAGEVQRHILFRDRLRADAGIRQRYLALKEELAHRYAGDRAAYAEGKSAFIDAVVLAAGGPARRGG